MNREELELIKKDFKNTKKELNETLEEFRLTGRITNQLHFLLNKLKNRICGRF